MAHQNIDERRFYIATLLSRSTEIDTAFKKKIASMFNCHVSAIYADCNHFAKNGWHWELTNGLLNELDK
ncbi:MAG TPA: hypothetical protein VF795_09430, partial [Desulfuromonadaceae bacterium]